MLHKHFQRQQITLPKRIYDKEYVAAQVKNSPNGFNLRSVAAEFGYTERRLRQIIKENRTASICIKIIEDATTYRMFTNTNRNNTDDMWCCFDCKRYNGFEK